MLRRLAKDSALLDAVDHQILAGVERGLTWRALVQSCPCDADETAMRIMRLIQQSYLEGRPGEDSAPPPNRAPAATPPPPKTGFSQVTRPVPSIATAPTVVPPRPAPSTPTSTSVPPGARSSLPPGAAAAREALLRELATRRSGASYPPINSSIRPTAPQSTPAGQQSSGYYSMRPAEGSASSVPPGASQRSPSTPTNAASSSLPPGRYSMQSEDRSEPIFDGEDTAGLRLAGLVDELMRGNELQRWCAARLHEAATHERAGELQQAINALQLAMSQNSDPRIRQERDRIQTGNQRAASGVFRARAITEERANKHKEAADNWRRVLEAC
ncbi:MAG TPA: hypothetical protein VFZ61_00345, partial [Polyangiales bacterium]